MSGNLGVIVAIAVVAAAMYWFLMGGTIAPEQARSLVEQGAHLVDVRTPGEFADGHIEGAVNIPVDQITGRFDEIGKRDEPVVVYCRSGARSGRAKRVLEQAGFASVHNLGAMSRW